MKNSPNPLLVLAALGCSLALRAGAQSAPEEAPFEARPVLSASQLLQPQYLRSEWHTVREPVTTRSGLNEYAIDSAFGTFVARGNVMLQERVAEIRAMAALSEMSKSKEFSEALKRAAKAPVQVVENLIDDPGATLAAVPKGVSKFLGRVSRGIKERDSGRAPSAYEDSGVKNALGVSKAKRELCRKLGVNPYSTNEIFQSSLDDVAWAVFAGGAVFSAATIPVGGAAGAALTGAQAIGNTTSLLYDQSPSDIRLACLAKLRSFGIPERDAEAFLSNAAFSPWHQARMIDALDLMKGIEGREILVRDATAFCANETDATFYVETASLIAGLRQKGTRIARISLVEGFPLCIGENGSALLALQWDYACWTPLASRVAGALAQLKIDGAPPKAILVALSGTVSPILKQELERRHIVVYEKMTAGPLR